MQEVSAPQIIIRNAQVDDSTGIAKVHVDVWRTAYKGIIPDHVLESLSYEQRAKVRREQLQKNDPKYCTFVAESDSEGIIGFAMGGPRREGRIEYDGELYAIYLYDRFHGRGVGKKLMLAVADWLSKCGHGAMIVWVLKDNQTRGFYEKHGGVLLDEKIIEIGVPLCEISFGWPSLQNLLKESASELGQQGLF